MPAKSQKELPFVYIYKVQATNNKKKIVIIQTMITEHFGLQFEA